MANSKWVKMGYGWVAKKTLFCKRRKMTLLSLVLSVMTKNNKQLSQYEQQLREDFDQFWNNVLNNSTEEKYFDNLTAHQMVDLKRALNNINNILTMKTTLAFARFLYDKNRIGPNQYNELCEKIKKPNSKGYDIEYDDQQGTKIIAEVKCNIPVNDKDFDSNQITGIVRDIEYLTNGKHTTSIRDISNCQRFFVLLDDEKTVKTAMKNLINKKHKKRLWANVTYFCPILPFDQQTVYVVFIPISSL